MKKILIVFICFFYLFNAKAQQSFVNGENAVNVLGQPDFISSSNTVSSIGMSDPGAVAISSKGVLAVTMNARVLLWNSVPAISGSPADVVVGQNDFSSAIIGCSQSTINASISGVCFSPDGNKLIISDTQNNRVLIWNTIPTIAGAPADVVIGQANFVSSIASVNVSSLNDPRGITVTADGKLIICDTGNNRVLIYNSIPTINGAPADYVLGQSSFVSSSSGSGLAQFQNPSACAMTKEGKLLVADQNNHRVLVFSNSSLSINYSTSDLVMGMSSLPNATANTFSGPSGVACSMDGKIFVTDANNNRVVIFNSLPVISSANADIVIGQPDFVSNSPGVSSNQLNYPSGVACDQYGRIVVVDKFNNRAVVFGNTPGSAADLSVNINNPANLCVGDNFITTVTVTNNSGVATSAAVIQTAAPNQFNYISSNASTGSYTSAPGIWEIPSIGAGVTVTLTINSSLTSTLTETFSFYAAVVYSQNADNTTANNSNAISVNTHPVNGPVVSVNSGANPACSDAAVTLTASGATAYSWSTGATTSAIVLNPAIAGIFTVTGANPQGCTKSMTITQTVNDPPTVANAGTDQTICGSSTTLFANTPVIGTGAWSVISGSGTFTSSTDPGTTVTGLSTGTNTFRWTISSNAPCANSIDDVIITSNAFPVVSVSTFSPVCFSVATYTLTGGTPVGGVYSGTGVVGGVLQTLPLSGSQTITYTYTDGNSCTSSATQTIFIESGSQISGVVNANGSAITNGNVYLLAYNNVFLMDTIQTFVQSATNAFVFNNVPPDDYIIFAQPDIANNSGAYNGNVSFWQNATPFTIDCSSTQTFTIETTTLATLTSGTASISGSVNEGPNFGSGKVNLQGDPIPGVDVSLEQNPGGIIIANTQTAADGKYNFGNLSAGNYTILVDIPGSGMVSSHTLSVATGQDWINVDYFVDSNKVYTNPITSPVIASIYHLSNEKISVYPNPTSGILLITNDLGIDEINIITVSGQQVANRKADNEKRVTIDVNQLPTGIYFIEIREKEKIYRSKIIKQ